VAQSPDTAFPEAVARFDIGGDANEFLSPMVYHLPAQLLVLHMARRAGVTHIPLKRPDGAFLIAKWLVRDSTQGLS
jgi:glucosamine--fructose-6-phosphate aminotransferase (isomerizing)